MLTTLLKSSNLYELEKAINNKDIYKIIVKSSNLSELGLSGSDLEVNNLPKILFSKEGINLNAEYPVFKKIEDEYDTDSEVKMHSMHSSLDLDSPSFLRKRESKDEPLEKINESDPPELKAFITVLKDSESLDNLSNEDKNNLISQFKETLQKEKNVKNKFYAKLSRPGSRTKLRNIIDKYVRCEKDENISTLSNLRKKIIRDGYLIMDPTPDENGNWIYKESEKLNNVFGKELKNNSITARSLYEIIRRSLNETDINNVNSKF